jgi:negative regulator of replication initiation
VERAVRTIRITDEVWQAIAARGTFGETEDDVLRRFFELEEPAMKRGIVTGHRGRGDKRYATKRMSNPVSDGQLIVEFEDGARQQWSLPDKDDKEGIRRVRDTAVRWALEQGASDPGQKNAVRKALTNAGYYVSR